MTQNDYNRELASFAEKISLAELEEAKAHERVAELKFQRDRFQFEVAVALCKGGQNVDGQPAPKTGS